jgi:hypothetical protein
MVDRVSIPSLREFYNRFKNSPEKASQEAFKMGQAAGRLAAQKLGLKGNDLNAIAKLINAVLSEAKYGDAATVEGDKVVLRARYYCPIMVAAASLKLPWEWLDKNFAWPWMKGVASVANPTVEFKVKLWRAKGDSLCEHFFEIKP